ncbi:hypothetical protein ACIPL1_27310 [Pseudomonas sp. NPDC090202]|uniref:hypothetical protein n=1 Tax=Pseudomonas sp. NPDC090202 TaxID=3364476 RepID=UPI0038147A0A
MKHDTDLLQASNVNGFREWLKTQGIKVTPATVAHSRSGILFWADVPNTYRGTTPVSVCEGVGRNARYARTHERLRPYIDRFLASPVAAAVKDAVRPPQPKVLQVVVNHRVQEPKLMPEPVVIAPPAPVDAQGEVKPLARLPLSIPYGNSLLLTEQDIRKAIGPNRRQLADDVGHYVIGVRAGAGMNGRTVAALMRVIGSNPRERLVEVIDFPLVSDSEDIAYLAQFICATARELPACTVLVDAKGMAYQLYQQLGSMDMPTVKVFGALLGNAATKEDGANKRFVNQRAQCFVDAANAMKAGNLELVGEFDDMASLGSQIPFHLNEEGRYRIASTQELCDYKLAVPERFEAISLAFLRGIDFNALPPQAKAPAPVKPAALAPAPAAPIGKVDQFLTDLRDDFAINCPLQLGVGEDLAAFTVRRWEYAELMVKNRPADVRG